MRATQNFVLLFPFLVIPALAETDQFLGKVLSTFGKVASPIVGQSMLGQYGGHTIAAQQQQLANRLAMAQQQNALQQQMQELSTQQEPPPEIEVFNTTAMNQKQDEMLKILDEASKGATKVDKHLQDLFSASSKDNTHGAQVELHTITEGKLMKHRNPEEEEGEESVPFHREAIPILVFERENWKIAKSMFQCMLKWTKLK